MISDIEQILITASSRVLPFDLSNPIKGGHNGPYLDNETPVRNTAHWLIVFSCLYSRTGEDKYKDAAQQAITYLNSDEARPMKAAFYCRNKKVKDFCNGVMGQAWVIEALLYAYKIFAEEELYQLAEEVFLMHDFDRERSIWFRLNVDGSQLSFDNTYNHQLWFAAVGSQLYKSPKILEMCDAFFQKVGSKPELYSNGVLYHNTEIYCHQVEKSKGPKALVDFYFNKLFNLKQKKSLYLKSVGYHGFNLYALELLKGRYGNHDFYQSTIYKKMISVVLSEEFNKDLEKSTYSYAYNPPAFENGYALLGNGYDESLVSDMLEKHFLITANSETFNSNVSNDIDTSEARLYELVRILDLKNLKFNVNAN